MSILKRECSLNALALVPGSHNYRAINTSLDWHAEVQILQAECGRMNCKKGVDDGFQNPILLRVTPEHMVQI